MQVPYVDLIAHNAKFKPELMAAVERVLDHGWFILGPEVERFEQGISERLKLPTVIGVNSGTDALLIALRAAGVRAGDEVLTVSHSFVATATAIRLVGATPVFVDVDDDTMLMDPTLLDAARTERTTAVLPVHLNGHPADLTAIKSFCDTHALALIEDAAQAIGAEHNGRSVGSDAIAAWSLHPLKVLSAAGDGGFVTLPDSTREAELRQWRNLGLKQRGVAEHVAGNTRLDALHAAMLCVKLAHLDTFIDTRRAHAAAYREELAGRVRLPPIEKPGDRCVYSAFCIRHPKRDVLVAGLQAEGVDAKIHYPIAIHQQAPFADLPADLPVTERVVNEIISLPVTPEMSEAQRAHVITTVKSVVATLGPA